MVAPNPLASGPRMVAPLIPRTDTSSSRRVTATTAWSSRASSPRMPEITKLSSPTGQEIRRSHLS